MKQLITFGFLFVFLFSQGKQPNAYSHTIDSLEKAIENLSGIEKALLLYETGRLVVKTHPQDGLHYFEQSKKIADSLKIDSVVHKSLITIARIHLALNDSKQARKTANELLALTSTKDKTWVSANETLASSYLREQNYSKALETFFKILPTADSLGFLREKALTLAKIGNIHASLKNNKEAKQYWEKYLLTSYQLKNNYFISNAHASIGYWFQNHNMLDSCHHHYAKAMKFAYKTKYYAQQAKMNIRLAHVLHQLGRIEEADYYSNKAFGMARSANLSRILPLLYGQRLKMLTSGKRIKKARNILDSLEVFTEQEKSVRRKVELWGVQYETYKELGEFEKSIFALEKQIEFKDTVSFEQHKKNLDRLETKYKVAQKEAEINRQNLLIVEKDLKAIQQENEIASQKRIKWFSIIGLLVLAGLGYFLYNRYQSRQKLKLNYKLLDLKHKALQLQLNPHFLFNAIGSVNAVINSNKIDIAQKSLIQLSNLMRGILKSSRSDLVSLEEEISTLRAFLELSRLVSPINFEYNIEFDDIEIEEVGIPPMLIQPIIENAIKHGIEPKNDQGLITLRFKKHNEFLVIEVEDNGVGRNSDKKASIEGNSVSTQIIKDRLIALTSNDHNPFEIKDLENPTGTKVILKVKWESIWD